MTHETVDLHFKALSYAFPICNFLILLMNLFGATRSRAFRPAFLTLALASILWLIPQSFQALLDAQKDLGQQFFPKTTLRPLIPYTFASNWLAIPVHFIGFGLLVRQAIKTNDRNA